MLLSIQSKVKKLNRTSLESHFAPTLLVLYNSSKDLTILKNLKPSKHKRNLIALKTNISDKRFIRLDRVIS